VLTFKLNENLYLRDPQATQLGQNMIQRSVELIDQLGFEQFTFKKLAVEINSTEPSVYRYFENKHRLLHYLVAWYWNWLEYRLNMATTSIEDPTEKLLASLRVITEEKKFDPAFEFMNEKALHRIVINELDKTYLTKWVDDDNQEGLFGGFKVLTRKISLLIKEIAPQYEFPSALASTILLAANQQQFFIQHLPSLSDINRQQQVVQQHTQLQRFVESIVFGAIHVKNVEIKSDSMAGEK